MSKTLFNISLLAEKDLELAQIRQELDQKDVIINDIKYDSEKKDSVIEDIRMLLIQQQATINQINQRGQTIQTQNRLILDKNKDLKDQNDHIIYQNDRLSLDINNLTMNLRTVKRGISEAMSTRVVKTRSRSKDEIVLIVKLNEPKAKFDYEVHRIQGSREETLKREFDDKRWINKV